MAEGIVSSVAEQLGSPVFDEIRSCWVFNDNLEELKDAVERVKAVLLDAEEKSLQNNKVKVWLGQLKQAFYEADDLLDEFSTEALRRKLMPALDSLGCAAFFELIWDQILYFITKAHRVSDITQRLKKIFDTRNFQLEERSTQGSVVTYGRETHSSPPAIVVGREDDKRVIMDALLSADCEDGVGYISVVGIGGLGKTTLAQLVFNDEKVKEYFEPRLWACVSGNFDLTVIIRKILGRDQSGNEDLNTLKDRLLEKINGKTYLLVLDDVWSDDLGRWSGLTDLLVGGSRGSRVIVTTRSEKVALVTLPILSHEVKGLSEIYSWLLLKQMAFSKDKECSDHHEKIGKEILKKCCGVPLAIRAIGGILFFKDSVTEWQAFEDKEIMEIDEEKDSIRSVLEISYNHLPPHLKNCFVYCRLFPKDSRIVVPDLINYWVAQGFVKVSDANQCPMNVGLEYFKELSWRSFFQEGEKDEQGNIFYCKMHDLIHDLATKLAGVESVMFDDLVGDSCMDEKTLHASFLFGRGTPWKLPASLLKAGNLRTFLLLDGGPSEMEGTQWDVIISNFKRLRMLELRSSQISEIPCSISKLKHLRHLDFSFVGIKVLSDSITTLHNLLILTLDYCSRLEKLPRDTQKLVNLSQLSLLSCYCLTHMPQGMGQLSSLHKLSKFVVAKNSSTTKHAGTLKELGGLNKLRGWLEITNLGHVRQATEFQEANLKGKQHLHGLKLDWERLFEDDDGTALEGLFEDDDGTALEALQPHVNLKVFTMFNYRGSRIATWLSSLTNLVKLSLCNCYNCQHLPPMHQLCNLKDLSIDGLQSLEYIDNEATTNSAIGGRGESTSTTGASSFFPSLVELTLWDCPKLQGWWRTAPKQSPRFPCLSRLIIHNCPEMNSMPLFTTFKTLQFGRSLVISLKKILNTSMAPAEECTSSSFAPCVFSLSLNSIEDLECLPEDLAQNLHSLKSLAIRECCNLKTLGQALQHLTSLESHSICNCCRNLNLFEEAMHWQALRSLHSLYIEWIPTLEFFPSWFHQAMPSLQRLCIRQCYNLKCLPEWMGQLPSLQNLIIEGCSQLSEICGSKKGADWPNIASIPNIKIDNRVIQENDRYMLS